MKFIDEKIEKLIDKFSDSFKILIIYSAFKLQAIKYYQSVWFRIASFISRK
jgi:hypothetical protein